MARMSCSHDAPLNSPGFDLPINNDTASSPDALTASASSLDWPPSAPSSESDVRIERDKHSSDDEEELEEEEDEEPMADIVIESTSQPDDPTR